MESKVSLSRNELSRRSINFVKAKKSVNSSISSVEEVNHRNPQTLVPSESVFKSKIQLNTNNLKKSNSENTDEKMVVPVNPETGLFPKDIVAKYLRWNTVYRLGPGFFNEGNTCFLNSTLQCLLYLPPFSQCLLLEPLALKNIGKFTNDEKRERTVVELYSNLVKDIWQGPQLVKAIAPKGMISCIRRVGKQFKPFRQEDAHEYLRQLLDCMHEEVLKFNRLKTSDGKKAETTVISRVFGGYLCNTLTCTRCHYSSKTYNHFQDLSLEIRQGINSVQEAIQAFTKIEYLTQGNEWKCDGCKNRVKATKQLTVKEAPNVLVLHLKRFSYGNMFGKISKHVEFSERLTVPIDNHLHAIYELTGVVVHHGHSTHSGHYIAFVKAPNGQWYEMNDSSVSLVSIKRVLQSQGYLLFYTRVVSPNQVALNPKNGDNDLGILTYPTQLVEKQIMEISKSPTLIQSTSDSLGLTNKVRSASIERNGLSGEETEIQEKVNIQDDIDDFVRVHRLKLPLRFTGPLYKFRRWRIRKVITDVHILGRILKLKAMHSKGGSATESLSIEDPYESSSRESSANNIPQLSAYDAVGTDGKVIAVNDKNTKPFQSAGNSSGGSEVLISLLEQSRRGRNIGGEGVWDSVSYQEKEKINHLAVQQRRKDQEEKKKNRLSDWDMVLDQGRTKKIKTKHEVEEVTDKISPFQRVIDNRNVHHQRGEHVDLREEPTFKHDRKGKKYQSLNMKSGSHNHKFYHGTGRRF